MKTTIIRLECDKCKTTKEYEDGNYFGGHPSNGWTEIGDLIFCCHKCISEYYKDK